MGVKIYQLTNREIHMVGDYVGVAWNLKRQSRQIKGEDGITYTAIVPVRDGQPYIDFAIIRDDNPDNVYEDEDSPVDGGLSAAEASQIANELVAAVEYLKAQL